MNAINIEDRKRWWESSGGEVMGGHFNQDVYEAFLKCFNNMTYEERANYSTKNK